MSTETNNIEYETNEMEFFLYSDDDEKERKKKQIEILKYQHATASAHLSLCSSTKSSFETTCYTGVRVYDGSKVLAAFFLNHPVSKRILCRSSNNTTGTTNIIELGSGAGLSSLAAITSPVAKMRGSVTVTDMEMKSLELAKKNVEMNQHLLSPNLISNKNQFRTLKWGAKTIQEDSSLKGKFQLVIGAELLYNATRECVDDLLETIKELLCSSSSSSSSNDDDDEGIAIMCQANRISGGREKLPKLLEKHKLEFLPLSVKNAISFAPDSVQESILPFAHRIDLLLIAKKKETIEKVLFSSTTSENDIDIEMTKNLVLDKVTTKNQNEDDGLFVGEDLFE